MSIQSIASTGLLNATHAATAVAGPQASFRSTTGDDISDAVSVAPVTSVSDASQTVAVEQKQQVEAAVNAVKEFIQPMASNLAFEMDDDSGRTVIRITEASSGELIRQIPSEEMLEIAKALDRLQGLLVKQKA